MSYRIVVSELAIEVDQKKELRTALKALRALNLSGTATRNRSRTEASRRIRRRLQEITKPIDAGQSPHIAIYGDELNRPFLVAIQGCAIDETADELLIAVKKQADIAA